MSITFIIALMIICGTVAFVKNAKAKALPTTSEVMGSLERPSQSKTIDLVNRYVTMARARAVRVHDTHLTVVYARENRTKGRVRFHMDTDFDDVHEGDVGIVVIVEGQLHGEEPFYKFIRDADIPTIDDIIEVGTGDVLTDQIYAAARDKSINPLQGKRAIEGDNG